MPIVELDAIVSAALSTGVVAGAVLVVSRIMNVCRAYVDRVAAPALLGVAPIGFAPAPAAVMPPPAAALGLAPAAAAGGLCLAFHASHVADWMAEAPEVHPYRRELADAMREQLSAGSDVHLGPTDAEIVADALDGF